MNNHSSFGVRRLSLDLIRNSFLVGMGFFFRPSGAAEISQG